MQFEHRFCGSAGAGIHLIFLRLQCPIIDVSASSKIDFVIEVFNKFAAHHMLQMFCDTPIYSFFSLLIGQEQLRPPSPVREHLEWTLTF
jgi:hypothetical protein